MTRAQMNKGKLSLRPGNKLDPVLEQRLADAAWNEALAAITTGLAHDTNNCLTGILSMADACFSQTDPGHPLHENLELIQQSAQKANQLLQQLMHVHHDKTGTRTYHDLNALTAEMVELLKRVVRRHVEFVVQLHADPLPVCVDAVELRRPIVLLALNAAQVMSGQSRITFQTALHQDAPAPAPFHGVLPAPPLVCLTIMGEGPGRAGAEVSFLFDAPREGPLATEDAAWRLHLAAQIMENNSGAMSIASEPGKSTKFELWLPQADLTESERR